MKDAKTRDSIAQDLDILCFEMEAAGLMDSALDGLLTGSDHILNSCIRCSHGCMSIGIASRLSVAKTVLSSLHIHPVH